MAARWALVGRDAELAAAEAALDETPGHCVLVGDAGVGKSRLVHELADRRADRLTVLWVSATRAAQAVPFGAVAHLLPDDATAAGDRLQLLQRAIAGIRARRGDGDGVLLVVDDAHLLDDASATLVLQTATSDGARVVLTVRAGEPVPDPVTTLWKDGLAARLELGPLDVGRCGELLEAALGGPVDRHSAHRVWEATGGNPLFVRELVLSAQRAGAIAELEGVFVWRAPLAADGRLHDAIRATLGELDADLHDLAGLVAAGERIPLDAVERLVGSEVLARAERFGVVEVDTRSDEVVFCHPIYGELLRTTLPAAELRAHQRTLLTTLASTPPTSPSAALRRAVMQLDLGVPTEHPVLEQAAHEAVRLGAFDLAHALAITALPTDAADVEPEHGRLGLVAIRSLIWLGHGVEAAHWAEAFIDIAPHLDPMVAAQLAIEHNRALFWDQAEVGAALEALDRWQAAIDDPVASGVVASERASDLAMAGRFDEAEEANEPLLDPANDVQIRLRAFSAASVVWMARGNHGRVMALADELLGPAFARQADMPDAIFWIGGQRVLAMMSAGELDAAEAILDAVDQLATSQIDEPRAMLVLARGLILSARGKPRSAVRQFRESLALCAAGSIAWRLSWIGAVLAEAAALAGDPALAAEALDIARTNLRPNVAGAEGLVWRATAWTAFAEHGASAGRDAAVRAAKQARENDLPWLESLCLLDALLFGAGREIASRLEEVSASLDGRLAPVYVRLGQGLRTGDPDVVLAAADAFAVLGQNLNAAAAGHWAAERFRRHGRLPEATAASTRAGEWAGTCEGARSPVLVAAARAQPAAALTRREREIVLLAAAGRANRDIADTLSVSVRTVEGHLARAYAKLGISSRDELAELGFGNDARNA